MTEAPADGSSTTHGRQLQDQHPGARLAVRVYLKDALKPGQPILLVVSGRHVVKRTAFGTHLKTTPFQYL
ncbi:uncharacterized protein APUU_11098S [Aspergillus puulaauensis]|uniref:Uncharacterized protein n=1 Tax=Aspergillus puulaauensis TaxID=1220207 RepID=A0A7R7XBN7_9EURO|nr:uncharacterized protein APUU_11098S [Aspergillus puulaauensis]BCS18270.1 hypothetical protein APUU_11098S [Aspergillus puulaauensis]